MVLSAPADVSVFFHYYTPDNSFCHSFLTAISFREIQGLDRNAGFQVCRFGEINLTDKVNNYIMTFIHGDVCVSRYIHFDNTPSFFEERGLILCFNFVSLTWMEQQWIHWILFGILGISV